MKNNDRRIAGRIKSFGYAFQGIRHLLKDEPNSWIHVTAMIAVIAAGFYFSISGTEWLWVASAICAVFVTELLNTAIENLVDMVQPEFHPIAGKVKDLCAAAVLVSAFYAVVVGLMVFSEKVWTLVTSI